jgi:hypothetical protein
MPSDVIKIDQSHCLASCVIRRITTQCKRVPRYLDVHLCQFHFDQRKMYGHVDIYKPITIGLNYINYLDSDNIDNVFQSLVTGNDFMNVIHDVSFVLLTKFQQNMSAASFSRLQHRIARSQIDITSESRIEEIQAQMYNLKDRYDRCTRVLAENKLENDQYLIDEQQQVIMHLKKLQQETYRINMSNINTLQEKYDKRINDLQSLLDRQKSIYTQQIAQAKQTFDERLHGVMQKNNHQTTSLAKNAECVHLINEEKKKYQILENMLRKYNIIPFDNLEQQLKEIDNINFKNANQQIIIENLTKDIQEQNKSNIESKRYIEQKLDRAMKEKEALQANLNESHETLMIYASKLEQNAAELKQNASELKFGYDQTRENGRLINQLKAITTNNEKILKNSQDEIAGFQMQIEYYQKVKIQYESLQIEKQKTTQLEKLEQTKRMVNINSKNTNYEIAIAELTQKNDSLRNTMESQSHRESQEMKTILLKYTKSEDALRQNNLHIEKLETSIRNSNDTVANLTNTIQNDKEKIKQQQQAYQSVRTISQKKQATQYEKIHNLQQDLEKSVRNSDDTVADLKNTIKNNQEKIEQQQKEYELSLKISEQKQALGSENIQYLQEQLEKSIRKSKSTTANLQKSIQNTQEKIEKQQNEYQKIVTKSTDEIIELKTKLRTTETNNELKMKQAMELISKQKANIKIYKEKNRALRNLED